MMNYKYLTIATLLMAFISFNAAAKTENYANNDGIEIFYVDYGPADHEPILLVQGLGGQLTFWPDELIELLTWADSISYTEILVKTHIERARSALDIFADSKAKSALQAISDIVIDRFE